MKIVAALLGILIGSQQAISQPCSEIDLLNLPGKFKAGSGGSVSGIAPADLARQKEIVNRVNQMVLTKYKPRGLNITYSGAYFRPAINKPNGVISGNSYVANYFFKPLFCDSRGILSEAKETSSSCEIRVNTWQYDRSFFVPAKIDEEDPETDVCATIKYQPEYRNGAWYFADTILGGFNKEITRHHYIITKGNELPFIYLSKKEYLERLLKYYDKKIQQTVNNNRNPSPEDAEYAQSEIKNIREFYGKSIANIHYFLKTSDAAALAQPATVRGSVPQEEFEGFPEKNDRYQQFIIRPNAAYFDPKLPKSSPQFMVAIFFIHEKEQVFVNAMNDLMKILDFAQFQAMVDNKKVEPALAKTPTKSPSPAATGGVYGKQAGGKANTITMTGSTGKKMVVDIYIPEPTKGFKASPVAAIKNVVTQPVVDARLKAAVMAVQLTSSNRHAYLKKLLFEIEQRLGPQQMKNTVQMLDAAKSNPTDLADMGVALLYKGWEGEALWCLAQAAAFQPGNDYILNNLSGALNMSYASARALPILRDLVSRHPKNTTVLNNLGQAWYAMGENQKSKAALDNCLQNSPYHPQANYTRAAIAELEGNNTAAAGFLANSMRRAYNHASEKFADRKGIKLDYGNILYRKSPFGGEYINPQKFIPPPQCENVNNAEALYTEWQGWNYVVSGAAGKVNAEMAAAMSNAQGEINNILSASNKKLSITPLHQRAGKMYHIFLEKLGTLTSEMENAHRTSYTTAGNAIRQAFSASTNAINKKYPGGEGQAGNEEARCRELNQAANTYLKAMADLNNDFNQRYGEPIRQLNIELMRWSQLIGFTQVQKITAYYDRALFAIQPPGIMHSEFEFPACKPTDKKSKKAEIELPQPYCPISFKFKAAVAKFTGDCSKFELEIEAAGLIFGYERDFVNKKSTLAFGGGVSLDMKNENELGISENRIIGEEIPEFVDVAGAGIGAKVQYFVEWDREGVSDLGIRTEVAIEGPVTNQGDIKVNGKLGINSGVDITATPAAESIGKAIGSILP